MRVCLNVHFNWLTRCITMGIACTLAPPTSITHQGFVVDCWLQLLLIPLVNLFFSWLVITASFAIPQYSAKDGFFMPHKTEDKQEQNLRLQCLTFHHTVFKLSNKPQEVQQPNLPKNTLSCSKITENQNLEGIIAFIECLLHTWQGFMK